MILMTKFFDFLNKVKYRINIKLSVDDLSYSKIFTMTRVHVRGSLKIFWAVNSRNRSINRYLKEGVHIEGFLCNIFLIGHNLDR